MKVIDIKNAIPFDKLSDEQKSLVSLCRRNGLKDESTVEEVESVLAQINNVDFCYEGEYQLPTTPLHTACENDNILLVERMLIHGAAADIILSDGEVTPLWNLQYPLSIAEEGNSDEQHTEPDIRLRIARVLLEHGADPQLKTTEPETLYEYVEYKVYNEIDDRDYPYIKVFYELLKSVK